MKRLRLFILIFFVMVSVPLAFVVWQTYAGLEQEERAQLRFFSEALFDQMEKELADLVQQEENRAVDEYRNIMTGQAVSNTNKQQLSPLAEITSKSYILGYLQNNPDGSFQTPLVADMGSVSKDKREVVAQLKKANATFNQKKFSISHPLPAPAPAPALAVAKVVEKKEQKDSFSDRFLSRSKSAPTKTYLGKKKQRVEEITAEQAYNIAREDDGVRQFKSDRTKVQAPASVSRRNTIESESSPGYYQSRADDIKQEQQERVLADLNELTDYQEQFQVEVAPFQSVAINDDNVYIFRRIAINNQIYRQGLVLLVKPFMRHLIAAHFENQPLAEFATLQMERRDQGQNHDVVQAGVAVAVPYFVAERVFPAPFDFLSVSLKTKAIPASPTRSSLNVALVILGTFMFLGLLAIYQSARTIVAMSERRSQFVSSVTHELKTPLTNIRMYIEMLEQGIAATPEREQEYLGILGSESTRLSGLINNVLELAKLEKKQRHFHMQEGQLDDVFTEVETIMSQKLKLDGFTLNIEKSMIPIFSYDRDVIIQILMNLIENSVKFGKHGARKEITISAESKDKYIRIAVSDTGPGIPRNALKKVFDDFYRVENDLTRTTGGTGIGLALVKKFITAMGGNVEASNNPGSGCTIAILLPMTSPTSV